MANGVQPSVRAIGLLYLVLLAAGVGLAIGGRELPAALPGEAAPEDFAAGRAARILGRIAQRPHPAESEAHACVREFLLEELRALGLEPELQEIVAGRVALTNVLVRIPGYDSTGTLLCLAHYDSVPTGPGAGDDSIGVAAWLEAFRALRARGWQPRNDVVLLLSDGEELGLRGAFGFRLTHPLAKAVRCVVNLEAIGNGGPAVLFELGRENGARVRLFQEVVAAPTGTSLGDAVYRRMPNDTDLTVFLLRGVHGFNLAVTSGSPAYHAPHDTPANLDARSLQHMGATAMALAEALGERDLTALDAPDVTFFDLLGRRLVVHPRALDFALAVAGSLLVAAVVRRARPRRAELVRELTWHLLECALVASLLAALWLALDGAVALVTPQLDWVPGNTTSGALVFAGLVAGSVALVAWRAGRADEVRVERSLAGLLWLAVASLGALVVLPGASFVFALPLLAAAGGAWLVRADRPATPGVGLLLALPFAASLLLGLPIAYLLLQLFLRTPGPAVFVLGGCLAFFAAAFLPQVLAVAGTGRGSTRALLVGTALAFALASLVSRVLVWRQGALWP
jgi:peptidase M28-like protein